MKEPAQEVSTPEYLSYFVQDRNPVSLVRFYPQLRYPTIALRTSPMLLANITNRLYYRKPGEGLLILRNVRRGEPDSLGVRNTGVRTI